jgi:hypothetical protein
MVGSDGVTPATALHHCDGVSGGQAAALSRETIVFCGDAEQVSAGFALALSAMEAHPDLLTISPPDSKMD